MGRWVDQIYYLSLFACLKNSIIKSKKKKVYLGGGSDNMAVAVPCQWVSAPGKFAMDSM